MDRLHINCIKCVKLAEWCQRVSIQQEKLMKRICLAALTGALAISTVAVAIDVASAAPRGGAYRGGVNRVGVGRVGGVNRVGVNRVGVGYGRAGLGYGRGIGYGRGALAYRGGWNGYYRPGLGLAAGAVLGTAAAIGTAAAYGSDYYGNGGYGYGDSGYGGYASAPYGASGGDAYILDGNYISEADAVAYCAQRFRSYDAASQTFLAYSGERVSCPQ
jgi:hypothetical protein